MDWVRFDVSAVPPQGGYVAKQCPVRAQWDVLQPVEPLPPSDSARRRMDAGIGFESEIFERLAELHPSAVTVERGGPGHRDEREALTVAAMEARAPLIIGGRLPVDTAGRRVGEPDVLVASDDGGYHPVDVKHHRTLSERPGPPAVVADLATPARQSAETREDLYARKHKGDLLQVAHYRRMLHACGHAASSNRAGIIGSEGHVTWYELDDPIWRTPSRSEGTKLRSTMEVYDFEFAFRLDILAVSQRHLDDPSVEPLVVPVRTGECASCPWWNHCEQLLRAAEDVSLVPYQGWSSWKMHQRRGVHTVRDLAMLDRHTADLHDRGVDLAGLFAGVADRPADTPVPELIGRRKVAQAAKLAEAGVFTAADVGRLDRRIAEYGDESYRRLAESIDLARAWLSPEPVFRRRGVERIEVPRGDVEVDLDLENTDAGVYLWGALVTDRSSTGLVVEGYRSFVTWHGDPSNTEHEVFQQLCGWLAELRSSVHAAGGVLTSYCYNERVEAGAMGRLAAERDDPELQDWVAELVGSPDWVDLMQVARAHLITGGSMGLKALAQLAGFAWEDDDPGGEQSMHWHHLAVCDPDRSVRRAHRERILTYNRNDVEATLALRDWMDRAGSDLPRIDALDPQRPVQVPQ